VLLVEDNPAHVELIRRNLTRPGVAIRIRHAPNGQLALEYLRRQGAFAAPEAAPRPHVILLDLRLPKVDGLEVLAAVKADEQLRQIPVVILTTSDAEADLTQAYALHANSYLVKPVEFDKFQELMRHLGLYWLAHNAPPPAAE